MRPINSQLTESDVFRQTPNPHKLLAIADGQFDDQSGSDPDYQNLALALVITDIENLNQKGQ